MLYLIWVHLIAADTAPYRVFHPSFGENREVGSEAGLGGTKEITTEKRRVLPAVCVVWPLGAHCILLLGECPGKYEMPPTQPSTYRFV